MEIKNYDYNIKIIIEKVKLNTDKWLTENQIPKKDILNDRTHNKLVKEMKIIFEWLEEFFKNMKNDIKEKILICFSTDFFIGNEKSNEIDAIFLLKKNNGKFQIFNIEVTEYEHFKLDVHDEFFYKEDFRKLEYLHNFYFGWVFVDEIISIFLIKTPIGIKKFYRYFSFENYFWISESEIKINDDISYNNNIIEYFNERLINRLNNDLTEMKKWMKLLNIEDIRVIFHKIIEKDIVFINGPPGTGKTLLFFYLLESFKNDADGIILNRYYDINSLNYCKSIQKSEYIFKSQNKKYLIIDEAQLSWQKLIDDAINEKKKIILIGDTEQKFIKGALKISDIESLARKNNYDFEKYELKNYIRFSKNSLDWIKFFLSMGINNNNIPNKCENFLIKTKENLDSFIEEFNKNKHKNDSVMGTISCFKKNISNEDIWSNMRWILYLDNQKNNNIKRFFSQRDSIFNTYHLISYEYNKVFIFLPKEFIFDGVNASYNNVNCELLKNELWIIFTRARKEIIIFSENKETNEYFMQKQKDFNEVNLRNCNISYK